MMNPAVRFPFSRLTRWQWIVLAGAVVIGGVVVFFVLQQTGALAALQRIPVKETIERIAAMGPLPFLLALAILPAFGAPVSVFYVIAGKVFEQHGGLWAALAGCFAAIAVNIALSYALARWIMHPVIARLVGRLGWKVPQVRHADRWIVTLLVRITPGPPFFVQHYLLALGGVPFGAYMLVSVPIAWILGGGFILFGDSLASGSWGKVFLAIAVLVVVFLGVRFARQRLARQAPAELVAELPVPAPAEDDPPRTPLS